jgi:Icc-related predicted phosphoesterase
MPLGVIYLEHESVTIEGVKIFGSAYTPEFGKNWAFNVPKDKIAEKWAEIPDDTDILITHGPAKGILDLTQYDSRPGADGKSFYQCGCPELLERVLKVQPKYHIFGHIHSEKACPNAGMLHVQNCKTIFVNATVCDFTKVEDPSIKSIKNVVNNGFVIEI